MRNLLLGALFGAGLVATAAFGWNTVGVAHAQRPVVGQPASGQLITFQAPVDEHRQQLTVLDPQLRVACVYHIDRDTGELTLKSVRNIHWDLQMTEFNSTSPRPREIQAMLQQQ